MLFQCSDSCAFSRYTIDIVILQRVYVQTVWDPRGTTLPGWCHTRRPETIRDASHGAREAREDGMRRERGDGDDGRWW